MQSYVNLGPTWTNSGPILCQLGTNLGPLWIQLWANLGQLRAKLPQLGRNVNVNWANLAKLAQLWPNVGPTWANLGPTYDQLGDTLDQLGTNFGQLPSA